MAESTIMLAESDGQGRLTPRTEFLLFPFGVTETAYGPFELTAEDADAVMAAYASETAKRDGWLDIDYQHRSRNKSGNIEDLLSAGKFRLALREDGIWAVDITYTDRARPLVEAGELWCSSVVFDSDKDGHIRRISQLALTNIPASLEAGIIAASLLGAGAQESIVTTQRPVASPSVIALAETMGYSDRMEAVRNAAAAALNLGDDGPWCCLEYIDDTTAIIEVYGATGPGPSNRYYRTTYEIAADGTAKLGTLEEVAQEWIPKTTQETAMSESQPESQPPADTATVELSQRVEHLTEVQTRLLSLTGETTPGQALIKVEAALRDASAKPALEKRLGDLEKREYTREREVLLSAARRDGKWTVDMEANADTAAEMAGRLGEDRVTALSAFWKRAPVVVAPGGHSEPPTPDPTTTVALSQTDREAIDLAMAQYPSLKREDLERDYLANKTRMLTPRF